MKTLYDVRGWFQIIPSREGIVWNYPLARGDTFKLSPRFGVKIGLRLEIFP